MKINQESTSKQMHNNILTKPKQICNKTLVGVNEFMSQLMNEMKLLLLTSIFRNKVDMPITSHC